MNFSQLLIPLLIAFATLYAVVRRVDCYDALVTGARQGLKTAVNIVPSLCVMLTVVYMFRASGAMDLLQNLLSPVFHFLGIPESCAGLMLTRPMSFSGALASGTELMEQFGPDSTIGRTAAVMLGSTETTFYTVAVYFGAAKVKNTRHAIPAALVGDFVSFLVASFMVRVMFG